MLKRILCAQCRRPRFHCYCEHIVKRDNTYPIKILQSKEESKHPLNTGKMAVLSLSDCEINPLSKTETLIKTLYSNATEQPVLAYPTANAADVSTLSLPEKTPIIFIDTTWRKAKRCFYENPALQSLPSIRLPAGLQSPYPLRQAKKHIDNLEHLTTPLSTFESILFVLSALEGRRDYYEPALNCLRWVWQKQLHDQKRYSRRRADESRISAR